ncbi:hypothetical protein CR513_27006, partial [Mucuna pruriens]
MVIKEVRKLLAIWIIYPASENQWVVPKKSGMTMVKKQNNELVPTKVQNSWELCIDYKKLNQETHKDHFPLPFIDQVLERLADSYCTIDKLKTTFTCLFGTFAYTRMPFDLCNALNTF